MSNYIGNQPAFGEFKKLDSIVSLFNGSTAQFNLEHNSVSQSVGDSTQLIVSLNGIIQEPGSAYTLGIGGGSIVFASAPASTDTCHIVLLGGVGSTGTVSDGSITSVKLASNLRDLLEEEFTGNGSATTFTMARSVSYSNQLLVTISGVVQPTSAYSVSGTTLTISPALPNGTNIRILHIGIPGAFNSANSILPSMLSSTGGTANQVLAVNANATGIEFQTVSGGGGGGIALTDLSVSVGSAGTSTLAYNNSTGAFAYTPPDLSSYLTSVSASNLNSISIDALSDVDTTTASPSSGQVLKWDGSNWAPAADSTSSGSGSTGQTITAITANTTLSNSDKGKLIQTETSGITITIPALSSLDADWFVDIETLNTNTFNHGKVTLDITTNNSGASINSGGNETMYGASKIRLQRSPAGGDSQGQLSAFASNYLTGGIIVREDRLAGGLQGGDVGVGSIMLGNAQDASGNDAIAIGQLGSATGTGSVAIGSYNGSSATTVAAATGAVAIGSGRAGGTRSLALQIQNSSTSYGASGANSVAIGYQAKATRDPSIALGHQANATGTGSQAFGYMASATGNYSTAIGLGASASQSDEIAIGGTGKPVKIANRYTLPIADGTNGQVMTTDGSGVISFADTAGSEGAGYPADQSFTVTNNGSGAYTFAGGATGDNATLTLIRGRTYKFSVNASGHPFRINTSNTTGTSAAYVNGTAVVNNGAAVGDIYFTVPDTAPDTLYYNCEYHSSMAGTINVSNVVRIDKANGNLLVGTNDTTLYNNTTGTGTKIGGDGRLDVARQADTVATFNRTGSSDGEVVRVVASGTTVGSTGVVGGNDLYIAGGATGIRFDSDVAKIYPTNGTGAVSNGAVDIGEANFRFKDAYLSGGVYLGGTGAANKLEDYEEGTWTPTGTSGVGFASNSAYGTYTKIGNVVTLHATLIVASNSSSAHFRIDALPFNQSSGNAAAGFYMRYTTDSTYRMFYLSTGNTIDVYNLGGGATTFSSVSTGRYDFSGVYYTDS